MFEVVSRAMKTMGSWLGISGLGPEQPDPSRRSFLLAASGVSVLGPAAAGAASMALARCEVEPEVKPDVNVSSLSDKELWALLVEISAIKERQFNGLGFKAIAGCGGHDYLEDTINRIMWPRQLVLDSDSPSDMEVTAVTIAGYPVNIGAQGMPLSAFASNATSPIDLAAFPGRVPVGAVLRVDVRNLDASGHSVSGGFVCDEPNPYLMQAIMEQKLIRVATEMMGGKQHDFPSAWFTSERELLETMATFMLAGRDALLTSADRRIAALCAQDELNDYESV